MSSQREVLRAPFTACMWVTDYCNLDCTYCYAKPFSGRRMDTERALSLLDELVSLQVIDVTFAGGEPTLHPAILEMIKRCVDGGVRVGLLSNGVSLSNKMISELERITTKKNFIIQISLDSVDPQINDQSRGKTHRVLETLDRLKDSSLDVQLATVVHKKNVDVAHRIIEKYYPDFKRFHFMNLQRTSGALAHPELLLRETDTPDFWLVLNEYAKQFPSDLFLPSLRIRLRGTGDPLVDPEADLHQEATFDCASCSAGWTHVNITSEFDVLGCDIAKDYTVMGNVARQSFAEVWRSPAAEAVRRLPYPACYKITAPNGDKLENRLKPEFRVAMDTLT